MVVFSEQYSKSRRDDEIHIKNYRVNKNFKITQMPDVDYAITLANLLIKDFSFAVGANHKLFGKQEGPDFIFEDDKEWFHPGSPIHWKKDLSFEIPVFEIK